MPDANLIVWTTDWHMLASDSEPSPDSPGAITPTRAAAVVAHINALDPIGCFDTGDNKNNYLGHSAPVDPDQEWDNWLSIVGDDMPWLPVNAGDTNALIPSLPGNHDESYDAAVADENDQWPGWDAKFWPAPYHYTCDWDAARVRIIAIHTYIHHTGTAVGGNPDEAGFAHITSIESAWLTDQLNSLPERWQAIVVAHFPIAYAFGNQVRYQDDTFQYGLTPLNDILSDRQSKVVCTLTGHRHLNWLTAEQDGVTHISAGGVSYGAGNGNGTFVTLTYDPDNRSITFDCRYAASTFGRLAGFTPVTIQLQPHRLFFARS